MLEQEAIKVLTKAEKYRSHRVGRDFVEALSVAKNSLEKQIPKKPIQDGYIDFCPRCNNSLEYPESYEYCPDCGQALDWSDTE